MAGYRPLLTLMGEVLEGTVKADAILIGPCSEQDIREIQGAIDAVVLTCPIAWRKHFTGSIQAPDMSLADITSPLLEAMDAFRDTGPLHIVFVPDAATLAALPDTVRARTHHVEPAAVA